MTLPQEAKLFSADATSMYTNISTDVGILYIQYFIQENINEIPHDFPTELFLGILLWKITFSLSAIPTGYNCQGQPWPAACAYATVSYGQ